jgi:hypothetical protein
MASPLTDELIAPAHSTVPRLPQPTVGVTGDLQQPLKLLVHLSDSSVLHPYCLQEPALVIEEFYEACQPAFLSVPRVGVFTPIMPEESVVELSTNLLMRGCGGFENAADKTVACRLESCSCSEKAPPARPRADGHDRVCR